MINTPTPRETADHIGEANEKVADHSGDATTMIDHAELAACPFCGGDPFDCGFRRWECGLCGAKGPAGRKNDATSGWNSRAGEAALLSEIAALRGALAEAERDASSWSRCAGEVVTIGESWKERFVQAERQRDELRKALREAQRRLTATGDFFGARLANEALINQGAE